MTKHIASVGGVVIAAAFVVIFFAGRSETRELTDVAPRTGMSYDELMALGPVVSTQTGVTLGTSRHVVYLLACSGQADKDTLQSKALQAGNLARQQRLSDREAVAAVLDTDSSMPNTSSDATDSLKGC